ncbi:MAG: SDR family NAD(P)-dependent oxidoreductase, partial [Acidobacteriota bacterium]
MAEAGELAGKVALVTGASSGIGHATAVRLARDGARLALVARDATRLDEVAAEIGGGAVAVVIPTDLMRLDERASVIPRCLEHWGRLDILVNSAGI